MNTNHFTGNVREDSSTCACIDAFVLDAVPVLMTMIYFSVTVMTTNMFGDVVCDSWWSEFVVVSQVLRRPAAD